MPLILASRSPQRAKLLEGLGVRFEVIVSAVDEPNHPTLSPAERAQQLAHLKAQDVSRRFPRRSVLGADTLVALRDGTLLEKPVDAEDAARMLRLQSADVCTVRSALCLIDSHGKKHEGLDSTRVHFRTLTDADIAWWIGTDLWRERSGGFQIDGPGQLLIKKIEGDWTGVVGLPIFLFGLLCREADFSLSA